MTEPKHYIKFVETGKSESGKTKQIHLLNATDETTILGYISWLARWRRYSFYPVANTIFDSACLIEISNYLNRLMEEHRNGQTVNNINGNTNSHM